MDIPSWELAFSVCVPKISDSLWKKNATIYSQLRAKCACPLVWEKLIHMQPQHFFRSCSQKEKWNSWQQPSIQCLNVAGTALQVHAWQCNPRAGFEFLHASVPLDQENVPLMILFSFPNKENVFLTCPWNAAWHKQITYLMPFQLTDKMRLCNQLYLGEKMTEADENTQGFSTDCLVTCSTQLWWRIPFVTTVYC